MRFGIDLNTTLSLDQLSMNFEVTTQDIKNYISESFKKLSV